MIDKMIFLRVSAVLVTDCNPSYVVIKWFSSKLGNVDCLRTLLTLYDIILNSLTLFKGFETFLIDSAEMYEDIISFRIGNKSKPLLVVKPLDSSFAHCWHLQKQN